MREDWISLTLGYPSMLYLGIISQNRICIEQGWCGASCSLNPIIPFFIVNPNYLHKAIFYISHHQSKCPFGMHRQATRCTCCPFLRGPHTLATWSDIFVYIVLLNEIHFFYRLDYRLFTFGTKLARTGSTIKFFDGWRH